MYKINFFYKYPGVKYNNVENFTYPEWPGFVEPNTIIDNFSQEDNLTDFSGEYGRIFTLTTPNYDATQVSITGRSYAPAGLPLLKDTLSGPGDYIEAYEGCLVKFDFIDLNPNRSYYIYNSYSMTRIGTAYYYLINNSFTLDIRYSFI